MSLLWRLLQPTVIVALILSIMANDWYTADIQTGNLAEIRRQTRMLEGIRATRNACRVTLAECIEAINPETRLYLNCTETKAGRACWDGDEIKVAP